LVAFVGEVLAGVAEDILVVEGLVGIEPEFDGETAGNVAG
jgi:hypothetical protein